MVLLVVLGEHLEIIAEAGAFLSLLLYAFIALACVVMRESKVDWYKPSFKTPFYPVIPIVGCLGCLAVMVLTSKTVIIIGLSIVVTTLFWYLLTLRKNTTLEGASQVLLREKVINPLVAKAEEYAETRRESFPTILLPLSNPETQGSLLRVGTALAKARNARLHLAHVVSVPVQTPLEAGRQAFENTRREQETLLDVATREAKEQGVRTRSNALVAHDVSSALLNVADVERPNLMLLGWQGGARTNNISGVIKDADRSVLVLKDNGLNGVKRILVPVSSGPHSSLGLKVAQELAGQWGTSITAMTVQVGQGHSAAKTDFDHESLQLFQSLAEDSVRDVLKTTGVEAEVKVVIGTDVAESIVESAVENDLIIIGASDEWAVRQWLFGSLPDKVANSAKASVLMVRSKGNGADTH